MAAPGFSTQFSDLPATLPVFPLGGVLLLPFGRLPLNIFETRYLIMTDDALGADRLIGVIQPTESDAGLQTKPSLYKTGCAGRITAFSETDDGRYLVTLLGICRFDIDQEIDSMRGYRRIMPDWQPYESDISPPGKLDFNKKRLIQALKDYFEKKWSIHSSRPLKEGLSRMLMAFKWAKNKGLKYPMFMKPMVLCQIGFHRRFTIRAMLFGPKHP